MIDCNSAASALPHECQIVTELPAGGGDNGGLGGSSVGVITGVPVLAVGDGNPITVPIWLGASVAVRAGVRVAPPVGVAGPG